jgi:hypothetical protein
VKIVARETRERRENGKAEMAAIRRRRRRRIWANDAAQRAARLLMDSMTLPSRKVTEPRKMVGVESVEVGGSVEFD